MDDRGSWRGRSLGIGVLRLAAACGPGTDRAPDTDPTPVEHIWIDKNATSVMAGYRGYLNVVAFMYANKPLTPNNKHRVKVAGNHTGGTFNLDWTFTTGAGKRF